MLYKSCCSLLTKCTCAFPFFPIINHEKKRVSCFNYYPFHRIEILLMRKLNVFLIYFHSQDKNNVSSLYVYTCWKWNGETTNNYTVWLQCNQHDGYMHYRITFLNWNLNYSAWDYVNRYFIPWVIVTLPAETGLA